MRVNLRERAVLISLAAAACLASCQTRPTTVRLAVAVPLTGDLAADGKGIQRAVEMAVDEARKDGSLPMTVDVVAFDDRGDPETAGQVARRIAADGGIVAVIGHLTSGCSLAASRVYSMAGIPMLTPSATAPELTEQQDRTDWSGPKVVFRLVPSDEVQASYAADFAYGKLGLRRVGILQDQTPYGLAFSGEFKKRFLARGAQVAGVDSVGRGQRDFTGVLDDLKRWSIDGVVYGGVYSEFGPLLKEARAAGLAVPMISGDGSKADELFTLAGPAADGAYATVSGVPVDHLPSAQDFVARYRARYAGPDPDPRTFDDYAYEAARIVLAGVRRSGGDRRKLLEAIRSESHPSMLGDISFDSRGDTVKTLVTVTRADYKTKTFEPVIYDR